MERVTPMRQKNKKDLEKKKKPGSAQPSGQDQQDQKKEEGGGNENSILDLAKAIKGKKG